MHLVWNILRELRKKLHHNFTVISWNCFFFFQPTTHYPKSVHLHTWQREAADLKTQPFFLVSITECFSIAFNKIRMVGHQFSFNQLIDESTNCGITKSDNDHIKISQKNKHRLENRPIPKAKMRLVIWQKTSVLKIPRFQNYTKLKLTSFVINNHLLLLPTLFCKIATCTFPFDPSSDS